MLFGSISMHDHDVCACVTVYWAPKAHPPSPFQVLMLRLLMLSLLIDMTIWGTGQASMSAMTPMIIRSILMFLF